VIPSFLPCKMSLRREWNRHTKEISAGKKKISARYEPRGGNVGGFTSYLCSWKIPYQL